MGWPVDTVEICVLVGSCFVLELDGAFVRPACM